MKNRVISLILAVSMVSSVATMNVSALTPSAEPRAQSANTLLFSGNSQLAGIEFEGIPKLDQKFNPETLEYTATAYGTTSSLKLKPTAFSKDAKITVNGTALTGFVANVPIVAGNNTIEVKVTTADGSKASTYMFTVNKVNKDYRGRVVLEAVTDYTVTASSNQAGIANATDNNSDTFWQASTNAQQTVDIVFNQPRVISKLQYTALKTEQKSALKDFQIFASENGVDNFKKIVESTVDLWAENNADVPGLLILRDFAFPIVKAKTLRFVGKNTAGNEPLIIRDMKVYGDPDVNAVVPTPAKKETFTPPVASNPNISRASDLIIQKGIEISSWFAHDGSGRDIMSPEEFQDSQLTGVVFYDNPMMNEDFFKYNPNTKWGLSRAPYGSNNPPAFNPDVHKDILINDVQKANSDRLDSICFGDEQGYSDYLITNLRKWFDLTRDLYPHSLVFSNQRAFGWFNAEQTEDLVKRGQPDILAFDDYYWTTGGNDVNVTQRLLRNTTGQREYAIKGYDGTGDKPIIYGQYLGCYKTGYAEFASDWYEQTESQKEGLMNLSLAAGMKWFDMFRTEFDANVFLFFDKDGTPTHHFYEWAETFTQAENWSDHLTRLNSDYIVTQPGSRKSGSNTVENAVYEGWTVGSFKGATDKNKEYHIADVQATNIGAQNDCLPGDVVMGYLKPLPGLDTTEFFTSTAPKYFMVVNSLITGDGTRHDEQRGASYDTLQDITITLDNPKNIPLKKVNKYTGKTEDVALTPVEGQDGKYTVTFRLGGGEAELLYWEENNGVTASSSVKDHQADFAFDGHDSTTWMPATTDNDRWIAQSFDEAKPISKAVIKENGNKVQALKVQYLDPTDSQWKDVTNKSAQKVDGVETVLFDQVNAKGIKLILSEVSGQPEIKEFYVPSAWTGVALTNGKMSLSFENKPLNIPSLGEFDIQADVNGTQRKLTNMSTKFNDATKALDISFDKIRASKIEQTLTVKVTYQGEEKTATVVISPINAKAQWDFEEGTGVVLDDKIGTADAAISGGTAWVEGRMPGTKALKFNGTDTVAKISGIKDLTGDWTMSMWVKRDSTAAPQAALLSSTKQSENGANAWWLFTDNYIGDRMALSYEALADNTSGYTMPKDKWVNVSITTSNSKINFYEDGEFKNSIGLDYDHAAQLPLGYIGARVETRSGREGALSGFFKGAIDDIRVYDMALTQSELKTMVNTDLGVVDKVDLQDLLKQAREYQAEDYTTVSFATLQTAIGVAQREYDRADITQAQVTTAITNLQTAINGLARLGNKFDLQNAYNNAISILTHSDEYTAESIKVLQDAVDAAKVVLDNPQATATDVDTARLAISEATTKLEVAVPDPTDVDKTDLKALSAYAKAQKLDPGYVDVVNAVKVALDKAISAADAVIAKANATQAEVNAAYDELLSKVHMLEFKGNLDRLKALVALTSKVNTQDYIPETLVAFNAALANAKDIIANGNTLQADIETAYIELRDAHMALRLKPNKDKLQSLIDSMNSVNLNNFTAESVAPFSLALSEAIAVNSDPNASQVEVDNATSKLNAKFKALVPVTTDKPVVTPDEDPKVDVVEDNKKPATDKTDTTVPTTADTTAPLLPIAIIVSMAALVLFRKRRED